MDQTYEVGLKERGEQRFERFKQLILAVLKDSGREAFSERQIGDLIHELFHRNIKWRHMVRALEKSNQLIVIKTIGKKKIYTLAEGVSGERVFK